jgi:3'-phosphoadenosine 5'-phosphosulfate sulfotransferase (PAPS reductase)/FAD synthetase
MCRPLSLWTEKDVWKYIELKKIKISPIYKVGYKRSGCMVCMFGMSLEKGLNNRLPTYRNRFELLYDTNPKAFSTFLIDKTFALWKPLTDMNIHLKIENKEYQSLYKKRNKQLVEWYTNFENNFSRVLDEIEGRNLGVWTKKERKIVFLKYKKAKKYYLQGGNNV